MDDNVDAARLLAEMLELEGHEARVSFDGPAALGTLGAFSPDVVLLDIGLPEMDGYEVARRLRALGAPCLIVAMTGYGQEADRARARAAGFDAYLVKPVDFREVATVLAHPDPDDRSPKEAP